MVRLNTQLFTQTPQSILQARSKKMEFIYIQHNTNLAKRMIMKKPMLKTGVTNMEDLEDLNAQWME